MTDTVSTKIQVRSTTWKATTGEVTIVEAITAEAGTKTRITKSTFSQKRNGIKMAGKRTVHTETQVQSTIHKVGAKVVVFTKTQAQSTTLRALTDMAIMKPGFNRRGLHGHTGTQYAPNGWNWAGFDRRGIHKDTGTRYNPEGYDKWGDKN